MSPELNFRTKELARQCDSMFDTLEGIEGRLASMKNSLQLAVQYLYEGEPIEDVITELRNRLIEEGTSASMGLVEVAEGTIAIAYD